MDDVNLAQNIEVDREFLVEIDSLLSLLVHRHGRYLNEVGEEAKATELYLQARAYYEKKNIL